MQKIPSVFVRDWSDRTCPATKKVKEGCEWVLVGKGVATEKFDGEAHAIIDGIFYRRLRVKQGNEPPPGWIHWTEDSKQHSGHGWAPVKKENPEHYWSLVAYEDRADLECPYLIDSTYELVGPKVRGNPHRLMSHYIWEHGSIVHGGYPLDNRDGTRSYEGIRKFLKQHAIEGIVFHHLDDRMAKVKRKDFGLPWPVKKEES